LYRDPKILVLDEGTANLDPAAEESIVQMLKSLKITRICVAHRPAVVTASDRIVLLESGMLRELDKEQCLDELN
jgi:ATP-binding cassette subfamily B protein RaxB